LNGRRPGYGTKVTNLMTTRIAASLTRLIERQREPDNLEMPFSEASDLITPVDLFYVRSHFPVPQIDPAAWRLRVEGAVDHPLEFSYKQLLEIPSVDLPATLECAGNGRSFLKEKVAGVQWGLGAVGTAVWSGIPLAALLDRAGIRNSAVEIVFEGADGGPRTDPDAPPGSLHFARSLPAARAREESVILAHRMNGAPLTPHHGFPVRLIVGGWYAVASVKWLTRIVVTERPFTGYYQTLDYSRWITADGMPALIPLTDLEIKSQIARPAPDEVVQAGARYRVRGAAWGALPVERVDFSDDGGASWTVTRLKKSAGPYAWTLWDYDWTVPDRPGPATLMARARDSRGQVQPAERLPGTRGYIISYVLPIPVRIAGR
jgi:DMSO/TMAO reductase YedYZ molybdopterin-dependent catalytic subunit